MPEQEGLETQLGGFEITDGVRTRAGEVTDRFIFHLGNIHGGKLTRAPEPCQLHGVTAVGFDLVAGVFRSQGRSDEPAGRAFFRELPVEPRATRAGFIDKDEGWALGLELADEVIEVDVSGANGAKVDDVGVMIFGNIGHRDGIFVHVQPNLECARLWHG
jgi:hypothetical protein